MRPVMIGAMCAALLVTCVGHISAQTAVATGVVTYPGDNAMFPALIPYNFALVPVNAVVRFVVYYGDASQNPIGYQGSASGQIVVLPIGWTTLSFETRGTGSITVNEIGYGASDLIPINGSYVACTPGAYAAALNCYMLIPANLSDSWGGDTHHFIVYPEGPH